MSKTLSLTTKAVYQFGLVAIGLSSLAIVILVVINGIKLFNQPKPEPSIKIREQQLNTAIDMILSKATN